MSLFHSLITPPALQAFGWALLHFLWQGTLVAVILACLLSSLKKQSAAVRYTVAGAALAFMLICPLITTVKLQASRQNAETLIAPGASPASESVVEVKPAALLPESANLQPPVEAQSDDPVFWPRVYREIESRMPWLMTAWFIGVIVLSVRVAAGFVQMRRLKRRAVRAVVGTWQETCEHLRRQLRVSRPVQLLESALALSPMAIGWLRPVILLPASALTGLTEQQLRAILAHELAHIRRYDYLINLLQVAVETLFFYHPAVWWVSRQVRIERENCCDDLAVIACGDALTYARALTEMERLRRATPQLVVAANGGMLMNRIRRIVGVQAPQTNRFAGSPAILLVVLSLFIGVVAQMRSVASPAASLTPESTAGTTVAPANDRASTTVQTAVAEDRLREIRPAEEVRSSAGENLPNPPNPEAATPSQQDSLPADVAERVRALKSADATERAAAACSLGRTHEVAAIPYLVALLGDGAAIEMTRCWENTTWSPALQSLKNPSPGEQAALALASMGEAAVRPLIDALTHADANVRCNAAWAIGEVTGGLGVDRSDAVAPLIKALKDEDLWVRKAAAFSLGELRDRRAIEMLIVALEDQSYSVRDMAARALGEMKVHLAVKALSEVLLKDEQWSVRTRAAWALGEIKDRRALEALQIALNDEDRRVRGNVKEALAEILDN